jgi:hypothetical protein
LSDADFEGSGAAAGKPASPSEFKAELPADLKLPVASRSNTTIEIPCTGRFWRKRAG